MPLHFYYATTPVHETLEELLATGQAPVYVVHPTQAAALERAQALTSINVATRGERDAIAEAVGGFRFSAGFGRTLSRLVRHGIGVHHAGMLPRYRRLVETLAQAGLLKVVCGTDTLGVGINVPIRTVLVTSLSKYDGVQVRHLTAREFHQVAGRAGRAGFDTAGHRRRAGARPRRRERAAAAQGRRRPEEARKLDRARRRPRASCPGASRRSSGWSRRAPEPLTSSFRGHARDAAQRDRPARRPVHRDAAPARGQPRAAGGTADSTSGAPSRSTGRCSPAASCSESTRRARTAGPCALTVDLQPDFALNQPLSPFAVAALELLDRDSPTYALDVLSVLESTLEDPRQVLSAQRNKARGEAVAAMKAEGIEYDERMELLEDVTYPQPLDRAADSTPTRPTARATRGSPTTS